VAADSSLSLGLLSRQSSTCSGLRDEQEAGHARVTMATMSSNARGDATLVRVEPQLLKQTYWMNW
jgi:hypothetical protein